MESLPKGFRRAVLFVAAANLLYFGVEFFFALKAGSVSLFADSVDFLEDTSVNLLILLGLSWSLRARSRLGLVLAALLLVPSAAALYTAWRKFAAPSVPDPEILSFAGGGAMVVNAACAYVLARYRRHGGSLARAAFLSARNDVLANVAIVAAGLFTFYTASVWPDLAVGIGIALLNLDAAQEVWEAAREEGRRAEADQAEA